LSLRRSGASSGLVWLVHRLRSSPPLTELAPDPISPVYKGLSFSFISPLVAHIQTLDSHYDYLPRHETLVLRRSLLAAVAVRPCSSIEQFIAQKYDYLIVGGGTAGLVLAARLTENPKVHVAVVEAGKNRMEDMQTLVPALFTKLLSNPDYDWMHTTALQVCL
jgi:hypothetical protein